MLMQSQRQPQTTAVYEYLVQSGWTRDLVLGFLGAHLQGDLPLLSARGLTISYAGHTVVDKVDLDVLPGEVVAIVGLAGSGKSGLLKTLAGMVHPEKGQVKIKSAKTKYSSVHHDIDKRGSLLGISLQDPSLYPELSVRENIQHFARLFGLDKDNAKINAQMMVDLVGLSSAVDVKASQLNRGQRKLVDIALSLIHGPQVLILDDPFEGLDPRQKVQLRKVISSVNQKGVSVLISASSLSDVHGIATRVVSLDKGRLNGAPVQRADPNTYTLTVRTKDQQYSSLTGYLKYLGGTQINEVQGRLMCQTAHPEVFVREVAKHLVENNKQITELWCDRGIRDGAQ